MQPHIVYKLLGESYGVTCGQTVISLPTIPGGTIYAQIQVEGKAARAKFNSTNSVTTGVTEGQGGGLLLPINTVANPFYVFQPYDTLAAMRLISDTNSDGTINVVYFGAEQPS